MTPLERAARALYRSGDFDPHQFGEDAVWPDIVDYVRPILLAIREPSEAMVERGLFEAESCTDDWTSAAACLPDHVWKGMIDTALIEGDIEAVELSRQLSLGTEAAFKVGARVHKATGGANEKLKEAVHLSRKRITPPT